jgi:hypothetical protein
MNVKISVTRFALACGAAVVLLAGCQKKEEALPPPPTPVPAKPAIVSAEKNSFDEVTAKLDKGGNFYLYLSTEQVLSGLSNNLATVSNLISALPSIPGTGRQTLDKVFAVLGVVVQESGISQISGLGMSSIAREKGFYYNKVVLHHYPGQNAGLAWSLFGKSPHPLKELDLLPETTALATAFDFDGPLAWTNIQHAVQTLDVPEVSSALDQLPAKFKEVTGLDLDAALQSLGGEFGLILTLDQHKTISLPIGAAPLEIPNPGLCLVFKVNSNLIFDRVDQILKGNPLVTKVEEPDLKMRTLTIPLPIPVELRPSVARVGDYLLVASSDNLVREIVAVKSGKTNGYKSTDEFKRLSQGVPAEGNNFTLVSGALSSTVAQIQEKSMASQNLGPEALKSFQELTQKGIKSGSYSVGINGPDGWEGIGNGSQGGQGVLVLPAVAIIGMGAAIAIPNFVAARSTSQQNACINNLRLSDAAKQQWALENNKKNGDTPTTQDLEHFIGRGSNGEMPVCPSGGTYTIGSVGEKPTCSHPGHVLAQSQHVVP